MTDTASRVEVTRVDAEHLPALAGFYRAVWDPHATPESVRASREQAGAINPVTPGEPPPTWIVLREGEAIGHVTTIPLRFWLRGRDQGAYWVKGLWVLPAFQRSAVGFLVLKAAVQELGASLALAHDPAALRLFGAMGFKDLGTLPNDLRVLRSGRVLERLDLGSLGLGGFSSAGRAVLRAAVAAGRLVAPLADGTLTAWAALAGRPAPSIRSAISETLDVGGVDRLWESVRGEIVAGPSRDGTALSQRYRGAEYRFVHVHVNGELRGLGVVKRPSEQGDPRLRGIRVATLSDLLYHPGESGTGLAVLRGAEQAARAAGADALLAGASAAAIRPLMRRRAFLAVPANLHVLARFPAESTPLPGDIAQCWFTRGDSGGDGVF